MRLAGAVRAIRERTPHNCHIPFVAVHQASTPPRRSLGDQLRACSIDAREADGCPSPALTRVALPAQLDPRRPHSQAHLSSSPIPRLPHLQECPLPVVGKVCAASGRRLSGPSPLSTRDCRQCRVTVLAKHDRDYRLGSTARNDRMSRTLLISVLSALLASFIAFTTTTAALSRKLAIQDSSRLNTRSDLRQQRTTSSYYASRPRRLLTSRRL